MTTAVDSAAPSFNAVWNDENAHLNHAEWSPSAQRIWNVFSVVFPPLGLARAAGWVVASIAKKALLPAARVFDQEVLQDQIEEFRQFWSADQNPLQKTYSMSEHAVQTPDGASLQTYCFRHKQAEPGAKTVLLLNGNCMFSAQQPFLWLLELAAKSSTPCNFVAFDYRSVGGSTGAFNQTSDLFLDAHSVMQFIEEELKTPKDNIAVYGWSLGGSIAANSAVLLKGSKAPVVLQSTFSTASKVATTLLPAILKYPLYWLPWALRMTNCEMDTAGPVKQMQAEGRPILVIHHPGDPIIKKPANLYAELDPSLTQGICLGNETDPCPRGWNHHVAPLEWYTRQDEDGKTVSAAEIAAKFLLNSPTMEI